MAGFLYAPQALSKTLHLQMAWKAVSEYCECPHSTNIELVPPKAGEIVVAGYNGDGVGCDSSNARDRSNREQSTATGTEAAPSMWQLWKKENGFAKASVDGFSMPLATKVGQNGTPSDSDSNSNSNNRPGKGNNEDDGISNNNKKKRYYRSFQKLSWAVS